MRKSYHILYCLMAVLAVSCIKPDPDEIDGECPTCPYEDEDGCVADSDDVTATSPEAGH